MTESQLVNIGSKPDLSKQKIFFGETDKVMRVDRIVNLVVKGMKEESEGNTWFTKELDFGADSSTVHNFTPAAKRIFRLNVGYQTVMDSGISNGYLEIFAPIVTDPIWKTAYNRVGIEETIHGESYSYGMEQLFKTEASEFLDIIYTDPVIKTRMDNELDVFAEVARFKDANAPESDDYKKAILKMITASYLMEGIKFPFSFYVTFALNKGHYNAVQGFTRLLKLIAHDEMTFHIPLNLLNLKTLRTDPHQGFKHLFDNGWYDEMASAMGKMIVYQEIDWLRYLLLEGEVPGLNFKIGEHFIKYWAKKRLSAIKVPHEYSAYKSNDIISWFNSYRDINKQNTALQEASNNSYQKGVIMDDLDSEESWNYTTSLIPEMNSRMTVDVPSLTPGIN